MYQGEKSYGGDSTERAFYLEPTTDGGFLIVGESFSPPSGSKTAAKFGSTTTGDMWIVRVDSQGNQLWARSFGGSNEDEAQVARQTADGGFLVAGSSNSAERSGTKESPYYGPSGLPLYQGSDIWVVRLDANGNKLWDKSYGGTGRERVFDCQPTAHSGFVLAGYSKSPPSGNKTAPQDMGNDYWVVKLGPEPPSLRAGAVQPDGIPMTIIGPTDRVVELQFSTDLHQWTSLVSLTNLTGKVEWKTPIDSSQPTRLFRALMK